jgi:hypothetical protein
MATDSRRPGTAGNPDPNAGAAGGAQQPDAQTTTYGASLTTTHAATPPPPPRGAQTQQHQGGRDDRGDRAGGSDDGGGSQPLLVQPVYIKRRSRKKRRRNKKKYTQGTKPFQRAARGTVWAGYRLGNSFGRGFRTFARRSNRSASRRKDGFVRYALRDASAGFNSAARQFGRAPGEIANRIGTRLVRNAVFGFNNFVPFNPFNFGGR